ncbi:S-layer homology domain-containing protein [Pseudobacillus sp. FSL P4-0506]|uniref:S-layer homology domain-containing protein n=1 Tax=Pseudobacillus sp. FSL P4-0506 TaxID=2921576 RepID=UPI0030F74761
MTFRKRVQAAFMAVLLLGCIPTLSTKAASYSDVPATHWSAKEVGYLSDLGILKGGSNGKFNKDAPVTRAQAAAILVRAKKLPLVNVPNPGFKDVPASHPFYKEIAAAVHAGWFSKTVNFNPNGKLKRVEMAKITTDAFSLKGSLPVEWEDMTRAYWGTPYVTPLVANGITSGYTATKYNPSGVVTRAQFAVFIARALNEKFRISVVSYPKKAAQGIFYPQFKDTAGAHDFGFLNNEYAKIGRNLVNIRKEIMDLAREDHSLGKYYEYVVSYKVARADANYTSVVFESYEYTGGAHGYEQLFSYNYDVKNSRFISLDHLAEKSNYERAVIDRINAQAYALHNQGRIYWEGLDSLAEHKKQFYMTTAGFVVYFNPYEYGPYSNGIREFTLPYSLIR